MRAPTVHRNGTDKATLLEQVAEAHAAIATAIEKLQEARPNARDYYVQPGNAIVEAQTEHRVRLHKLADIAGELLELHHLIDQQ